MELILLPAPRYIRFTDEVFTITKIYKIGLAGQVDQPLHRIAEIFQSKVKIRFDRGWQVEECEQGEILLRVEPSGVLHEQGYTLEIHQDGIYVAGHDGAGLFYGLCTLLQIMEQAEGQLPGLRIQDWPDCPARGVMLDISRDKVPTMETLHGLVDMLAGWKINQLQLYMEHTFAYRDHKQVWAEASPMTGEEIRELDSYCRDRYIELVPNQNSFGHLNRWLIHDRYAALAEVQDGFEAPWGKEKGPFSICPIDPLSLAFINSLHDELVPYFSSLKLNVGCDETYDLGQGRSKQHCEQKGRGRVYLDFLLEVYAGVKSRGRTMMYWGDMVQEHPELVSYLPKDAIALEWGYEADHPFEGHCALLQAYGIPFYVCPGTSAWSSIAGRSDNAIQNLLHAAQNGKRYGAIGYLITDWGDNGHWQPLPISYLGFAAGAAYSWSLDSNQGIDLTRALDQHAFYDRAGVMGKLAYELGNLYQAAGIEWTNASVLSAILQRPLDLIGAHPKIRKVPFEKILAAIGSVMGPLKWANLDWSPLAGYQKELYRREFELAARMLRHACRRGILAVEIFGPEEVRSHPGSKDACFLERLRKELYQDLEEMIEKYEQVWLLRNRKGGLKDSTARLKLLFKDYQEQE
jgi:hexosaminidase